MHLLPVTCSTIFMARIWGVILLNPNILREITARDYPQMTQSIEDFIRNEVSEKNSKGVVFGLSGGIDSAVTGTLAYRALGDKATALIMPDSEISPDSETQDALNLAGKLGMKYNLIDICPVVKEYSKHLESDERATGNLRARIRANILYYYANSKDLLVLGSSDKSEWLIGYFTKFGDGASDLLPIISLYKMQVRAIATRLGIPQKIISKKSSPHLWKNHLAEEEIGVEYKDVDPILYCLVDKKISVAETAVICDVEKSSVERILDLYMSSEHKRRDAKKW